MKNFNRIAVSVLLASSALLLVGQSANASEDGPQNISCSLRVISFEVPAVPAKEAVYETRTIPAVTKTVHQFVHQNENHPDSPRWEDAGWNADSNPNSAGWTSTGITKEVEVTPETTIEVLVSEAVPAVDAIPAVTEEECITQAVPQPETPDVGAPNPALTCVEAGTQITAENPLYSAALDRDGDGIGCEVQGSFSTAGKAATPVTAAEVPSTPAPLAHVGSTEKPVELAYTGFNWGVFSVAILALGAGFGLLRINRKLA